MLRRNGVVPMNCIDMTWLALDSVNERILFHAILVVEGSVDPAKLNDSLLTVVQRHPALRSVLRRSFLRHYREVKDDLEPQILEVHDFSKSPPTQGGSDAVDEMQGNPFLVEWINRPLDPKKELPFRSLLLKRGDNKYWLAFTFHHYATDALRALRFLNEVIGEYNGSDSTQIKEVTAGHALREDDTSFHGGNELLGLLDRPKSRIRRYYPKIASSLFHRFVVSPFTPPSRIFHDRSGKSGDVSFTRAWLNSIELGQIDAKSRMLGATVNDVLLAAFFKAIEKWNRLHGKPSRKISIMVPVDIGRRESQYIVSNQISYVSPATMPEDRTDHLSLLKKVSQRTGCIIRNGNAFSMVHFTHFLSRLSFAVMKLVGTLFIVTRVYIDTTLLTNVGRIRLGNGKEIRLGSARITDVCGVTPVVTPWGMSVVTGVFDSRLHLGLTYRSSCFSDEKARRFLELYLEEIRSYILALEKAHLELQAGKA